MAERTDRPPVVVSHPAKQGYMYRIPLAYQRSGLEVRFLTGLYFKDSGLPARLARLLPARLRAPLVARLGRRQQPGLSDARVTSVSGPLPHLFYRSGFRHTANAVHDRLASRWLRRRAQRLPPGFVFHGFLGSCRRTLAAAAALGGRTVLEVTYPPGLPAAVAAEQRRLGLPVRRTDLPAEEWEEMRSADWLVAESPYVVDELRRALGPTRRIALLPMGIDTEAFHAAEHRSEARPFRALYLGRLEAAKGVHHLLEAWRHAGIAEGELRLVGTVCDGLARDLVARLPANCRHTGPVPHGRVPQVLHEADALVMPSLGEAGPFVVLEALASGLPCIVTRASRSVVRDGIEGFVVEVGDVAALAERMARLAGDAALRARMGAAARRRALDFSWTHFEARVGRLYDLVTEAHGAGAGGAGEAAVDLSEVHAPERSSPWP